MRVTRIRPARALKPPWLLRIELLDVRPLVWRRLRVPANITLPKLHRVFQAALGWTNRHLHEFVINGLRYAEPGPAWNDELKQVHERGVVLSAALGRESRSFDYVYDFGDHWHEEHQDYMEWCNGSFDPARFDQAAVNVALEKIKT